MTIVESLITPSRTPAPVTSSTPNPAGIVLIEHTSTPKPGETASRIIIGKSNSQAEPLSAITKSSANMDHPSSPTLSVFTTTDLSTSITPTIDIDPRSSTAVRAPTARGQAAMARRKIAEMQIRDDSSDSSEQTDKEDDNEEFTRLFTRRKSKKVKKPTLVLLHSTKDQSDISVRLHDERDILLMNIIQNDLIFSQYHLPVRMLNHCLHLRQVVNVQQLIEAVLMI